MTTPEPCGCRAVELGEGYGHPPEGPTIIYCPTHAAAFDLLAFARSYREWFNDGPAGETLEEAVNRLDEEARAAIASVRGEE